MPGGTAVPGMQRPGAGSAGAGAGKVKLVFAPMVTVKGVYDLRPKKLIVPKDGKAPTLVFEVYDENEINKGKRGEKHVNGAEVQIRLWGDVRSYNLFRNMGYGDDTWIETPQGFELPIERVLAEKPLVTCNVSYKEGNQPGRGFNDFESVVLKKARTT